MPKPFLDTAGVARKVMDYRRGESIYSPGEAAQTVMNIQKGGVKLSVVNGSGKEVPTATVVSRPNLIIYSWITVENSDLWKPS
jgi:CRP-like cAMP-binding protein